MHEFRVINVSGSSTDEKKNEPKEFAIDAKSWIDYYRIQTNNETKRLCSIHNCQKYGINEGHVEIFQFYNNIMKMSIGYCIIPLCSTHNNQRHKMRSDKNDVVHFYKGKNRKFVLIRDVTPANLPYNVIEYLDNLN